MDAAIRGLQEDDDERGLALRGRVRERCLGQFDSLSDASRRLTFPTELDGTPPFGKHCLRADLGKSETDAYVEESSGAFATTAGATKFAQAELYLSPEIYIAEVGGSVDLLQLLSAGDVVEGGIRLERTDELPITITSIGSSSRIEPPLGEWFTVELEWTVDSDAPNDGEFSVYLSNARLTTSSQNQGPFTHARIGALDQSCLMRGFVAIDDVIVDDERIYATLIERSTTPLTTEDEGGGALWTRSGFVFVGAGAVAQTVLIDGGAGDCRLRLYDSSIKEFSEHALREELRTGANEARFSTRPAGFRRGCYLRLEGTGPQAIIRTKGDL